jgi:solute carrier family 25 (mitochondrial carnitine/acylcarnitine transporter), member 20/29
LQNQKSTMTESLKSFLAGWAGGCGILAVGHPFDTVKTLMQANNQYKSAAECVTTIVKTEGPLALYKGVTAPLCGIGTVFALYFLAYDACERTIRRYQSIPQAQQLTLTQIMICGGSTGVVGSLVLGPAELLKVQQQTAVMKGLDGSFGAVCKRLYAEAGPRAFTRGLGATMMRDVPGSMAWFSAYEIAKQNLCEDPKKPTVTQALISGGCGGLGMWVTALPMDAVKTRVQSSQENMSFAKAARLIAQESGFKGFYRGFAPIMLRAFPANAACFATKESAQKFLDSLF